MKQFSNEEKWILGGASGRMITTESGYVGDGFIADVDTKENARHIVACVNACRGLPLPRLTEERTMIETFEFLERESNELRAELERVKEENQRLRDIIKKAIDFTKPYITNDELTTIRNILKGADR